MWVVEHPDVVETVAGRVWVKNRWMEQFCDFVSYLIFLVVGYI